MWEVVQIMFGYASAQSSVVFWLPTDPHFFCFVLNLLYVFVCVFFSEQVCVFERMCLCEHKTLQSIYLCIIHTWPLNFREWPLDFSSHLISPFTARVVGALQMILWPVSSIFPCSSLPFGTWWTPGLSIPWWCLPTSSSVCLVFFPFLKELGN